jgi:hypothetical protein
MIVQHFQDQKDTLHEVLKLHGTKSSLANDVMWAVLALAVESAFTAST